MSAVREKLLAILTNYTQSTPDELAVATTFQELNIDSVSVIAILDDVEESFDIKFTDDPDQSTITIQQFTDMIESMVAAKSA